ncbi:MAG: hypothetical protein II939_05560 [Bacteroidales bacterium]|nr:hypothetical protein [Bacteroidales bacterium]
MNTIAPLLKLKKYFVKRIVILLVLYIAGLVFINLKMFSHPPLYNPYAIMALQYVSIIATGVLVILGYRRYNKAVQIHKADTNEDFKRLVYIRTNRFQNNLIFIALALNILLMLLTFNKMFVFISAICFVFNLIYMPSDDKFVSDFVEQIDEERYETEINRQDSNNINQNFES